MSNMKIVEYQNFYILHLVTNGNFYILHIDIYDQGISIFDLLQNIVIWVVDNFHIWHETGFNADDTASNCDKHQK